MNFDRHQALWAIYALNSSAVPLIEKSEKEGASKALPKILLGKQVKKDFQKFGLTLREHPLKLLRPILDSMSS